MFTEPYIGMITIFAGSFAPLNWQFCQGQLMSIGANTALYAVIGNIYGGDGITTFALPDLRGRAAVGSGQAPGMDSYVLGNMGGNEAITLTANQVNGHTHAVSNILLNKPPGNNQNGTSATPAGNVPAVAAGAGATYSTNTSAQNLGLINISGNVTGSTGSTSPSPIEVTSPYLAMNYIICTDGIFPSQG